MKKVVFTFGRMNPPTAGHQKLVTKIKAVARQKKADAKIYLSHSQNNKKDPLDYNTKVNIAKKAFGDVVTNSGAKTIIQVVQELERSGYTDIIMVVGSDRVGDFKTLLNKYNGKDYAFNSILVVSAGQRDPDADDVSGMSASKLRSLAKEGQFDAFKAGLPKDVQSMAKTIYDKLRSIMEEDENELDEAVLSYQQRRARSRLMKRLSKKMVRQRKLRSKRMADAPRLQKRSRKMAISLLRKKVAGERGANYKSLGVGEKITIDKLVAKRSSSIEKLAKRLLPKVRKAEVQRLVKARTTTEEVEMKSLTESKKTFRSMFESGPNVERVKDNIAKEKEADKKKFDRQMDQAKAADSRVKESLERKATESGIPLDVIQEQYTKGIASFDRTKNGTAQQQAFQAVNTFIANINESAYTSMLVRKMSDSALYSLAKSHGPSAGAAKAELRHRGLLKNEEVKEPTGDLKKACWKGYTAVGMKMKDGKKVPNCVPVKEETQTGELQKKNLKSILSKRKEAKCTAGAGEWGTDELVKNYVKDTPGMSVQKWNAGFVEGYCPETGKIMETLMVEEAEHEGKKVKLNNPFRLPAGSKKKFGVYVKNDKGNVVKVTFGDPNMEIKRDDPERRKAFRSRHSCDDDIGPKWKARYWSCYQWRAGKKVDN